MVKEKSTCEGQHLIVFLEILANPQVREGVRGIVCFGV